MNALKSTFLAIVMVLSSCGSEPMVPKNDFEKAVFTEQRSDDDRSQDKRRLPSKILEFSQLQPGMAVVDFQASDGYYSEIFSNFVGESGKVYLHNVPEKAARKDIKAKIDARLEGARLPNVEAIQGELNSFTFPTKVDLVFFSKVFHDLYVAEKSKEREQKIASFFTHLIDGLKDNGKVLIIDHSATKGSGTNLTSETHRIDPEFVISVFQDQGFELKSSSDVLKVSSDNKTLNIWDGKVRNNTDRFVLLFEKK